MPRQSVIKTYIELFLTDESLPEELPDLYRGAVEGNLPFAKEKDLVKSVKDLAARLVDGHHNSSSSACHDLKAFQDVQ